MERAARVPGPPPLSQPDRWSTATGWAARMGIPTVNLTVPDHVLAPGSGRVHHTGLPAGRHVSCAGVTNVGTRPTVCDSAAVSVETFLLDFDGDLYGKRIRLEFCRRLRDEQKFDSLEALKAQIRENIRQTRDYFAAESTRR